MEQLTTFDLTGYALGNKDDVCCTLYNALAKVNSGIYIYQVDYFGWPSPNVIVITKDGHLTISYDNKEDMDEFIASLCVLCANIEDDCLRIWDSETFVMCYHCGEIKPIDDTHIIDDEYVCDDCLDEHYFLCEHCNKYHHNSEKTTVYVSQDSTEEWCDDCVDEDANKCHECHEYFSNDCLVRINGDYYCEECRDELFVQCDECGYWIDRDDAFCDDDGYYYCEYCYNHRRRKEIRSYHDNPSLIFHRVDGEQDNEQFIGTEIETECGDIDDRIEITKRFGEDETYIYQMHDGSLDDSGIECITQPMTKQFWDLFDFEGWMKELCDAGARSHDTNDCGLHVHLSRTWLKTDNEDEQLLIVGRMRQFLSDNEEIVKKYARRSSERWCAYSKAFCKGYDKSGMPKEAINDCYKKSVKNNNDRCQSINNQNRNTIEFRIFRGTLKPQTYRASVEFCLRLVDYVITHPDETLSWGEFVHYKELPDSMKCYMQKFGFEL